MKILVQEMKKKEPKRDVIIDRMALTVRRRQKWIREEKPTLGLLVEKFPVINSPFLEPVVRQDFKSMIPGHPDLKEILTRNVKVISSLPKSAQVHKFFLLHEQLRDQ